ncbi:MAG: phosphoadenosine phosphosulfate reductase family protein [Thermoplasmatales archaeon]|nr:MAG: phosphoadenosine phosphosulfate reductase family protein [Thermoplasmatales archaeon]
MKFVSLLSSGIDSPVATYLLSKKAREIVFLHADCRPFTDDKEIKNFINLANYLKNEFSCKIKICIIPHGKNLLSFKETCKNRFTCIFCKRMLLRYSEKIVEKEGADAIIMGDSLGQVASQTLQNIYVIEQAVTVPILRPLIGLDKEDIIKIAKEIGTYDFSIAESEGCSAVPSKPSTKANLEHILAEEKKLDINKMIKKATENLEFI